MKTYAAVQSSLLFVSVVTLCLLCPASAYPQGFGGPGFGGLGTGRPGAGDENSRFPHKGQTGRIPAVYAGSQPTT